MKVAAASAGWNPVFQDSILLKNRTSNPKIQDFISCILGCKYRNIIITNLSITLLNNSKLCLESSSSKQTFPNDRARQKKIKAAQPVSYFRKLSLKISCIRIAVIDLHKSTGIVLANVSDVLNYLRVGKNTGKLD